MTEGSDEEGAGDASPAALAALYAAHAPGIHRFLCDLLGDRAAAADATQETFLRAFRRLHTLEAADRPAPWLFGVARHVSMEYRRATRRGRRVMDEGPLDLQEERARGEPPLALAPACAAAPGAECGAERGGCDGDRDPPAAAAEGHDVEAPSNAPPDDVNAPREATQDAKGPLEAPSDVKAPPESATVTASGLAYRVLTEGGGTEHPKPTSRVTVHYTGWTTDGEMFDSSVAKGRPATLPLEHLIKGWTEGIQLMIEGEKTRFWIPSDLAYDGKPGVPAGMLVFDIELLQIH